MAPWHRRAVLVALALGLAASAGAADVGIGSAVAAVSAPEAIVWGARIDRMVESGELSLAGVQADGDFPGRRHLRYDQRHAGLRVFGFQLVRQLGENGRTLTVFGRLLEGLSVDPTPTVSEDRAVGAAEADMGRGAREVGGIERVILPLGDRAVLAYTLKVALDFRLERYFIDAHTGAVAFKYSELRTSSAIGVGRGVWDDRKKMSVDNVGGTFRAEDRLRPALIATYDLKFDFGQVLRLLNFGLPDSEFLAADSDNNWTDGGVVDAHAYAGFVYDYYFKRHNRHGLDDKNFPMISATHGLLDPGFGSNAFWNGSGMFYGDGDGGTFNNFAGALDVVAHELTHGVTQFTWNGEGFDQPGALNESFSDVIGTSVEFFYQPRGNGRLMADYFLGEDIPFVFDPESCAVCRSLENPGLFGDPDHFSRRRTSPVCVEANDFCGIHSNSAISSHAFFLLIEGGTNRTSKIAVAGLGAANREKAEKIFYRGFTAFLTPNAQFSDARAATIRAAGELFGASSNEAAQTAAAWAAVGVK